ncbi:MAG: AcvB/VirJ family lysyl-phosphatidylglycerol hydrolase [Ginsengibacter sp.]
MKKPVSLMLLFFSIIANISFSTAGSLPVKEWTAPSHDKPLIFYISGDGGLNKFSVALCESLNDKGFDVVALDAKSYFNNKKTPEQTSQDIALYLSKKLNGRVSKRIAFVGYSFGADVLPFVLNRLPKNFLDDVEVSFIMASSGSTDFETHWLDMLGGNKKRSMDVVNEINKIFNQKIIIINGSDDNNLDLNRIDLKKYTLLVLPGGHHFDGDTKEIVGKIIKYL